jgi:seryl-tRNA synthetase
MLDPRALAERREEIEESCRRRGVTADVGAAVAAQQRVAAAQTELSLLNRQRNEHQNAGRKKLDPEARDAHVALGRRLKEQATDVEARLAAARAELTGHLATLPNFVHPESPVGGEEDSRELRRVGEPPHFDFEPCDHVEIGRRLDLVDFEAGAAVTGPKFYFLKNEAVLLDLALQRFALDILMEEGFTPVATPDLARRSVVDAMAFSPRGPETQIYSIEGADLDLIGTAEITLGGLHADAILDEDELPTACISSPRWRCSPSRGPRSPRRCTRICCASRNASSRRWKCRTVWSTSRPAISGRPPTASTTSRRGSRGAATAATTAR